VNTCSEIFSTVTANIEGKMKSLRDGLPPEIAQHINLDWCENEAAYWAKRDALLTQYRDKWIGFADGAVVVSGESPVEVFHHAQDSGKHPFVTCVGREHEPCRMRRISFPYDATYPGESLPVLVAEFRKQIGSPGLVLDHVIPDTGADASALPWTDCQQLQLDLTQATPAIMGGVGQTAVPTVIFQTWVYLDGNDYPCRLQADFSGNERIIGRDVLNRMDVLFRGPIGEVVINP
jgi:predicted aspartyl protease